MRTASQPSSTTFSIPRHPANSSPRLSDFATRTSLLGALNSLTQLTLKATMPGVPDFYQGTEFWDLSFVDPDNRRPVDFGQRMNSLDRAGSNWPALSADWSSGRIKLAWTAHLLRLRQQAAEVFALGGYRPLAVTGAHESHVIAYARVHKQHAAIVIALRHFAALTDSGRQWPKFDAIDAQVPLDELELLADMPAGDVDQCRLRAEPCSRSRAAWQRQAIPRTRRTGRSPC